MSTSLASELNFNAKRTILYGMRGKIYEKDRVLFIEFSDNISMNMSNTESEKEV